MIGKAFMKLWNDFNSLKMSFQISKRKLKIKEALIKNYNEPWKK